jgi:hypothetical protein
MRINLVLGFIGFLLLNAGLQAQIPHDVPPDTTDSWAWKSGNNLYAECEEGAGSVQYSFCLAYVTGALDMIGGLQGADSATDQKSLWKLSTVCVPNQATAGQVVDIVLKYMKDHPEDRASRASWIVIRALIGAWKCPSTGPAKKQ